MGKNMQTNLPSSREIVRHVLATTPSHRLEAALTATFDQVVAGLTEMIKRGVVADLTHERDLYRAALAVVISDLGGEVTIPARTLDEAPALDEVAYTTTDESHAEGQDVTFRVKVR